MIKPRLGSKLVLGCSTAWVGKGATSETGFVYKSYFAIGGGGGLGGWVFSRVGGSKALDPPPSYNYEGFLGWAPATPSFFGHRSLVWLFAGAPFCCVVAQVAGVQVAIAQPLVE